jgi:hypothetical protein
MAKTPKNGGKTEIKNSDAKTIKGKNKGPLSMQMPKKPINTHGMGGGE